MAEYKIKVKQSPGWKNYNTCLVSISMGQAYHEGSKLDALLSWAAQNYPVKVLNISDTLHRHNLLRGGASENQAFQQAFALGNDWMRRNEDILKRHLPRFQHIHRWGDWTSHPDFSQIQEAITRFYEQNEMFRAAADIDIQSFVLRKESQGEETSIQQKKQSSFNYLMEEIAAYILMGRRYAANRVYPAKPLETFQYLRHASGIPESLKGMENSMCTRILCERRKTRETEPKAA